MNTCLFGGSFDPVHQGHVYYVHRVQESLHPDLIILMPANRSPFKKENPTDGKHRVEMLKRAFPEMKNVLISTWELERPGPSYTIDTVRYLYTFYDSIKTLYILVGMDQMAQIKKWKSLDEMIKMGVIFVVFPRKGYDSSDIDSKIKKYCLFIDGPILDISASSLREKIKAGEDVSNQIPPAVWEYIKKNNLYTYA